MLRGRDGLAVLAATAAAVALALGAQVTHVLDRVADEAIGARFQLRGPGVPSNVAVVATDDATFSDLEQQWPFPLSLHALVVDRLREAGAKFVVYDVQFTEPTEHREDMAL